MGMNKATIFKIVELVSREIILNQTKILLFKYQN